MHKTSCFTLKAIVSVLSLLFASLAPPAWAASSPKGTQSSAAVGGIPKDGEASPLLRRQSFDIVWKTVKEKHFDPNLGGVDWDGVRERYSARLGGIKTDREFYDLLQQMLGELHESHFAIYPPEALPEDDSRGPAFGSVGADLRIIDALAVITHVQADSPAARAGLGIGWVLEKIEGTPIEQIIERASATGAAEGIRRIHQTRGILARLNGAPGTDVEINYRGKSGIRGSAKIKREKLTGEMSARMGNFPPQYVEFDSGQLPGGIGYIRFNVFVMSIMDRLRSAIRSDHDAAGIIIDLRGNPGGVGQMACGLAGMLESAETSLGTMRMRAGFQNFAVFPQSGAYLGPVAVLIDEMSASTSEIFASGMQALGGVRVVGMRSAGAALPSILEKLPTGALFQYAIGDFRTPKGMLIEGRGVTPDIEVKLSREELLGGSDPQLQAAIKAIRDMKGKQPGKKR